MGGFKPSRADIAGSTIVGSDKDVDVHQFSGSVFISGSLTLNGSSVTGGGGGGGGAVANYTNSGDNRVITSVDSDTINGEAALTFDGTSLTTTQITASTSMKAAALQVSSSVEGALFRVDHSTQAGSKPIIFVTGSGLVAIGTDSPRTDTNDTNRLHIMGESGADQGINPAVNSVLVLENNDHVGMNIITPTNKSGMIVFGDADVANRAYFRYDHPTDRFSFDGTFGEEVMTIARAGDSVNIGKNNADHMTTSKASLHISSSTGGTDIGGPVLLRADHGDHPEPILFVTGSGQVGIGTSTPYETFHIKSAGSASIWIEADTDNTPESDTAFIKLTQDNSATRMIVGLNGNAGADPDGVYLANAMSNAGIVGPRTAGSPLQFVTSNRGKICVQDDGQVGIGDGFNESTRPTAILHISGGIAAQGTGKTSPLILVEHDDNDNILFVTGSGRVGIGTATPTQALDVAGTANATTLSIGGTSITSTAAELNLLDASNGSPSAGAWGAVERIGVYTIAGAKAGSAIGGGGTNHTLGTLPAGAYVTEAYLDITSVFAIAGGAVAISIGTATTYPAASRPFLEVCQPGAIPRTGGTIDATAAPGLGVITLSAGSGFSPALFPGAKLPAQENVILNVADGGGGTDGLTASGATLILKYIVM